MLDYVWLVNGKGKRATLARKILAVSVTVSSKQAKMWCFLLMYVTEVITVGLLVPKILRKVSDNSADRCWRTG